MIISANSEPNRKEFDILLNSTLDELISQTTEKKFVNSWQKKFIYSSYKW